MKLELRESNSPFWLLGLSNGKTTAGSFTNKPCYYKSGKKWYELAKSIINQTGIDEVYVLTGVEWDNMKGSWDGREAGAYVRNKGKLILSKNEITFYENKYGPVEENQELKLPNKTKLYTSSASTLEGDEKMKLELKDEETLEEAVNPKLIVQGIMLAIDNWDELVKAVTKLKELSQPIYDKAITILQYLKDKGTDIKTAAGEIANIVTTTESLSAKNADEETLEEKTKLAKNENDIFENAGTTWKVLAQNEEDTLIVALDAEGNERNRYVVAWGLNEAGTWDQGHYFSDKETAMDYFEKRAKKIESLKESKIVEPIGNPQTAGSFVNIDIDLDHLEVSDFIIRLTQAIRSEQNSILEYTALRSANGVTNEERSNIDAIIEEEKNHMAAITTMLYKQILSNHTENIDKANVEFNLPKFGADIVDETSKLKESIESTLTKIEDSAIRISDDYYIGDSETGRQYHGLGTAMDVIKNLITKSGDPITIQNTTLYDELNENVDIAKNADKYMIQIDVEYDEDVVNQIFDNLARVIDDYNKTGDVKIEDLGLQDGKFFFSTDKEVDETFVENFCKDVFDKATNYEYQIIIK